MDGCAAHSASSQSGSLSPAFRQESLSLPPRAADPGARGSRHLRPRAREHVLRHDQVPRPHELPGPAVAVEVARLRRRPRAQRLEMAILDHELLTVLLEVVVFFFNDTATTEIYTFPYTTLFRSLEQRRLRIDVGGRAGDGRQRAQRHLLAAELPVTVFEVAHVFVVRNIRAR